ncbi:GTPase HflX [Candidatus Uabimicrobium sp. HlEnr_7]|uniref:GTPase HflX n=1 Tax=Candidatus Uabimicrobium helgolandensis TaxID=3095367 RepID=UPI003556FE78
MKSFEQKTHSTPQEKAILMGVQRPKELHSYQAPLTELASLADTVGAEVVGKITQRRHKFHPGTYMGKGKIYQMKELAEANDATLIICDHDLSPGQSRNIEEMTDIRVIDRTELILDIFAQHAKTKEATLQVDLAQLEYVMPRLKRMWTHLEGSQGGIGFRGPGEKQLETDRQIIKKKIVDCKSAIKKIQERKNREVNARNQKFFTVGLVGYTNAGKSSLMNVLTDADVLVEDRLFATLDTRTRYWDLAQARKVLLSDTVGFIDKLPHHLVASFRATLEEAAQSDILLHVVDASHPDAEKQIIVVESVLRKMKLHDKNALIVFNKIDLVEDPVDLENLKRLHPNHVCISAKTRQNIDLFSTRVLEIFESNMIEVKAVLPVQNGKLLAWIGEYGRIIEREIKEQSIHMRVSLSQANFEWFSKQYGVEILA